VETDVLLGDFDDARLGLLFGDFYGGIVVQGGGGVA
jgi:hypothetical protein